MYDISELPVNFTDGIALPQFSLYRFVDPESYDVYRYQNGKLTKSVGKCYEIWHRTAPCVNCISVRATCEHKRFIKLEYFNNSVTLINSVPIKLENKDYVLELAESVTDSFAVNIHDNTDENNDIATILTKMNRLMSIDIFTGLYNRKYIVSTVNNLIAGGGDFSGALLDIDKFKTVNDTYGHLSGDGVILKISEMIKEMMESDKRIYGARSGGDEFFIVFDGKGIDEIHKICSDLSDRISDFIFYDDKGERSFHTAISYGCCEYTVGMTRDFFISCADSMMYKMKAQKNSQKNV